MTTLKKLADGKTFCISTRKNAAEYTLQSKKGKTAIITSTTSNRTYTVPVSTKIFIK